MNFLEFELSDDIEFIEPRVASRAFIASLYVHMYVCIIVYLYLITFQAAVHKGFIYVVGAEGAERYDPQRDVWTKVS